MAAPKFPPYTVGTTVRVLGLPAGSPTTTITKVYGDYPTTYRYLLQNLMVVDHSDLELLEAK